MIKNLRIKLTLWFAILVMTAYIIDGALGVYLFNNRLASSMEAYITYICQVVAPTIEYKNGKPTLANWAKAAAEKHIDPGASIQLFDKNQKLLESYGAEGITDELVHGRVTSITDEKKISVYSNYYSLPDGSFLQTQVSSSLHDQATTNFAMSKIFRGLLMAFLIGVFGWYYSGQATAPIVRSLRTLRTFVDDAGHELNTPIALIENSIETVEAYLHEHNLPTDVLHIIQRASTSLKSLSQNLLLLAKMERPEVSLRFTNFNLTALVNAAAQDLAEKAKLKNIELKIENIPEAVISANQETLSQMFSNLIENAIRYTNIGGHIRIYGYKQDNNVCIAIQDNGCGISQECLPHIFDRFYRVDKARSKAEGGHGLGLSIVKAIIDAHKGSIRVESTEGKGSTFLVSLPLATPATTHKVV